MRRLKTLLTKSPSRMGYGRRVRIGLVALAAVAGAVATPAPAMASGDDFLWDCDRSDFSCQTGVQMTGTIGPLDKCLTSSDYGTEVCIRYDGDYVYVKDGAADGNAALARVHSNEGVADRYCRNPYGVGTWARCNFDWVEDTNKLVLGGIRFNYAEYGMDGLWNFSNN